MELLAIGELARRTGLTVKTVRFYADRGIELAGPARDPAFRAVLRLLAEQHAATRDPVVLRRDPVALVRDEAAPAPAAGIDPAAPEAGRVITAVLDRYPVRDQLPTLLEAACDPRYERYQDLLSVVNGWPAPERLAPPLAWFLSALRSH
jgi:hypothetical protein